MLLYRRTTAEAARIALSEGFRDEPIVGTPEGDSPLPAGVWLSDVPLDAYDFGGGPEYDTVLEVELADSLLPPFECIEDGSDGKPHYREWLVPAAIIREHGDVRVRSDLA